MACMRENAESAGEKMKSGLIMIKGRRRLKGGGKMMECKTTTGQVVFVCSKCELRLFGSSSRNEVTFSTNKPQDGYCDVCGEPIKGDEKQT
jgi:hypothetical protein